MKCGEHFARKKEKNKENKKEGSEKYYEKAEEKGTLGKVKTRGKKSTWVETVRQGSQNRHGTRPA